ncbi:MAG: DUF5627 domain-containing protein [Leeuwenhoekiella sp.]
MKTKYLVLVAIVIGLIACENQEFEFDDFGTTAVYFPFQTPVRKLILGDYELGFNDNDNAGRFVMGVTMSGVYSNDTDRRVFFEVAPELIDPVSLGVSSVNVQVLPPSYYTLEQESPLTIPAGSIKGRIPVQLNDAFFEDTLSFAPNNEVNYVIPLRITDFDGLDSLLVGVVAGGVANPRKIVDSDWEVLPKDYTLYGIKFMNEFEGVYLRRGVDILTNDAGETISTVYRDEFVVRDETVKVTTTGRNSVELSNIVRRDSLSSPGEVNFEVLFMDNNTGTVTSFGDHAYDVSGSAMWAEDQEEWGGQSRNAIYLNYQYTDTVNNESHTVRDTLVMRNRDVTFEEFDVEIDN